MPDVKDESVLAICTNPENSCLITGDTAGQVKMWDITNYCLRPTERVSHPLQLYIVWMPFIYVTEDREPITTPSELLDPMIEGDHFLNFVIDLRYS